MIHFVSVSILSGSKVEITHGLVAVATTPPVGLDGSLAFTVQLSQVERGTSIEELRSRDRRKGKKKQQKAVVDTIFQGRVLVTTKPARREIAWPVIPCSRVSFPICVGLRD